MSEMVVPPDGDRDDAELVVVGEAPATEEVRQGRGFVGPSGRMLWPLLRKYGCYEREECWVTNLCKHPLDNDVPGDEKLDPDEFDQCVGELEEELEPFFARGVPVLAVGRLAAMALLDDRFDRLEVINGIGFQRGKSVVIPTFHPAAALRPGGEDKLAYTARAISVIKSRGFKRFPIWIPPIVKWTQLKIGSGSGTVGVDTEGTAKAPLCMTLATAEGRAFVEPKDVKMVWDLLGILTLRIFHNAPWDWAVLEAMGVRDPQAAPFFDTMERAYLHQTEPQGLKDLAYRHFGLRTPSFEELVGPYWESEVLSKARDLVAAGTIATHTKTGKALKNPKLTPEVKGLATLLRTGNTKLLATRMGMEEMTLECVPRQKFVEYATLDPFLTQALWRLWV